MLETIELSYTYVPSEDVVAREIEDEFILVPLTSEIGEDEDELFSLNQIGRTIWKQLDRNKTLEDVVSELSNDFDGPKERIESDVLGFMAELFNRKMVDKI